MPNYEYYRACKEALKTPAKPSDDELIFEDCPKAVNEIEYGKVCLLYTSPSPRDGLLSRMPSSA